MIAEPPELATLRMRGPGGLGTYTGALSGSDSTSTGGARGGPRRDGHGPALLDQRPRRAEAVARVIDALAVRSDEADAALRGVARQLFLQAGAVRARLGEATGDDDGRAHLPLTELQDRRRHGGGGDDDHRKVGARGDLF